MRDSAAYVVDSTGETVERDIVVLGDPTDILGQAHVTNTTPGVNDYGLVVRVVGGVGGGGGAVYGPSAIGAVLSNPPIALGGIDAGGLLRGMRTDANGYQLTMITNGTQNMPTMDAAARRGYFTHTDGTNSMPTGDAVARAIYIRNTDGTNVAAVKAASTAAVAADPALVVALSPNNNVVANALFTKISDGTNTAKVQAASTIAAAADLALVVSLSPNSPAPLTTSANQACSNVNINATGALAAVKASAGNLMGFSLLNNTAAVVWISFWNVATGSVTLGSTAPTMVFVIPANGALTIPPGQFAILNSGTAISFAAVTAYNGASTASVSGSIFFK